ncbi:MAG: CheR family methyltransferase [Thermodesulfobacteriota bacterium]|nr:CheR family methyltransferase [Thermodesulfobacteriota bacterium]
MSSSTAASNRKVHIPFHSMDDPQFRKLLDFFGLSWGGYRKVRKGVKKRVARHMREMACRTVEEYLLALEKNPELKKQAQQLMTVSISRFFRDRALWQTMEDHILPVLIDSPKQKIKIWCAGCACGEEVYSVKILWERLRGRYAQLPQLELWATDLNPELLDRAQTGIYSLSGLKEVPEEWRSRYFSQVQEKHFAVSDFLKEKIFWKVHNLIADNPPGTGFSLIFLRNNLLTYYRDELRLPAVRKVIESLFPLGFLIIGAHEKLPPGLQTLFPFPHHPTIFQKTPTSPETNP